MTTRKVLQVDGMTCSSCELRIENKLKKMEGVVEAKAIYSSSNVYVTYDTNVIGLDSLIEAIESMDYKVKSGSISHNVQERSQSRKEAADKMPSSQLLGIIIIIISLYVIINNTVGFNFIPQVDQNMGYGLLFVVGLLTSLHCIAMCGGINLSQCVSYKYTEGETKGIAKLKPSLLYNMGRVTSYTIIGGLVGALGSAVSFSGSAKGIVAIISGVFMMIMGLNMLNIFPWLRKLNPRMPKIFGNKVHNNDGKHGPFYVGLLNGLMPCGPLQSMQLYALGTGSFLAGATSMFLFSLGTVPLMFGFGAISSLLSSKFTHKMLKVSAVLVMVLGFVMVNRGMALSGFNIALAAPGSSSGSGNLAKIEGNTQKITTSLESGRYASIVVQKGIPVKWTIQADKGSLNGCNNRLNITQYKIQNFKLAPGDNVIEFTPDKEGKFIYSCWMGMITGSINVVADINNVSTEDIQD
ncbi:MAG: heavy metal transporter, partial [Clostridiales bacterium]|nr:heavy metal transporter [Clostridiales bacterium]